MKLRRILLSLVAVLGIGVLLSANTYAAPTFLGDDKQASKTVAKDETIDGTLFAAGNTIRVDGTVEGDVFCAGSSIVVAGTVNGDVICAGSTVTIDGQVNGDVRAAASSIVVNGTIDGSATLFASDVLVASEAEVTSDLGGAAASVTVDGLVGRDLLIASEQVVVSGSVTRDVSATINELTIDETATVGGNVAYTSDREATINGTVNGETIFTKSKDVERTNESAALAGAAGAFVFLLMIGLLVFLGAVVAPRAVRSLADVSWASFGIATVVGVTTVLISPLFILVLFLTGIGAYLAWIWLLLWLLLMALAPIWVGYFVGTKIIGGRTTSVLLRATVGALVLMFALLLPIINVLVFFAMLFIGVGLPLLAVPRLFANDPYNIKPASKKSPTKKAKA